MTQTLAIATSEKFQNAEQLWFWFLYSKSIRNGFSRARTVRQTSFAPCDFMISAMRPRPRVPGATIQYITKSAELDWVDSKVDIDTAAICQKLESKQYKTFIS